MHPFQFISPSDRPARILCFGAHSDDIEIGCGGTLLYLLASFSADVTWIVVGADGERRNEAQRSAVRFLANANSHDTDIQYFRNSFFPNSWGDIKEYFESIKMKVDPDIIFTHYRGDLHQDHRVVSDLTWNTFRNHTILEYEIPKYDGDIGQPNTYMPLSQENFDLKVDFLMDCFGSQRRRSWFSADTFRALARIRGIECNSASGFAEAFYCKKLVLR
jgi:LmbE family N-acetylglucosaminyl deacetylase